MVADGQNRRLVKSRSGFKPKPIGESEQLSMEYHDVIKVTPADQMESSPQDRDESGANGLATDHDLHGHNLPNEDVSTRQQSPGEEHSSDQSYPTRILAQPRHDLELRAPSHTPRTRAQSATSQVNVDGPRPWNIELSGDAVTGATGIKIHGVPPDSEAAVMILVNALCGIMDKSGANDAKPDPSSTFGVPKIPRTPVSNMSKPTAVVETPAADFTAVNPRTKSSNKSSDKSRRITLIDTPAVPTKSRAAALATPLSTGTSSRTPNTTYGNYTHAEVKAEIERAASAVGETSPNKNRRDEIKAMYLLGQFQLFDRTGDVYERITKCSECVKRGKTSCFVVDEDRETVIVTQRCAWCLHDRRKCED